MKKVVLLVLIIALFFQTPFYKTMVVPKYTKFEGTVSNLLYSKPQDTRVKRLGPTDPAPGPVVRPAPTPDPDPQSDSSLSSFMPKKSSTTSVKRSFPQSKKSSKKSIVGWNNVKD